MKSSRRTPQNDKQDGKALKKMKRQLTPPGAGKDVESSSSSSSSTDSSAADEEVVQNEVVQMPQRDVEGDIGNGTTGGAKKPSIPPRSLVCAKMLARSGCGQRYLMGLHNGNKSEAT